STETEKRQPRRFLPTTVLSEPQGLLLFQVVRGRIEFWLDLWVKPWVTGQWILALDLICSRAHRQTHHQMDRSAGQPPGTVMLSNSVSWDRTFLPSSRFLV